MTPPAVTRMIWAAVVLLALVGIAGSASRAVGTIDSVYLRGDPVPEVTRFDEASIARVAAAVGIEKGTPEYAEGERQSRLMLGKFNAYPLTTLLHVGPAVMFMLLAPFQFSRRIRSRHPTWHRWSGRAIVTLAIPIGLAGLYFGLAMPFSGPVEAIGVALFGVIFLWSLGRAVVAIRQGDIVRHREWMLRMFAVAIGTSTVRLVGIALTAITREGPEAWFGSAIWIGFGLTSGVAELWIRGTRRGTSPRPQPVQAVPPTSRVAAPLPPVART